MDLLRNSRVQRYALQLLGLLVFTEISAQSGVNLGLGVKYIIISNITVNDYTGGVRGAQTFDICPDNKIVIERFDGNDAIISLKKVINKVSPDGNKLCSSTVQEDVTYCVAKSILERVIKLPKFYPSYGLFSVPFKFQAKDFQVFSSGNLGGHLGVQRRINWNPLGDETTIFIVGAAGYSRIPLNNVNTSDPEKIDDVGAISYGISGGITFGRFQIMLVKGWDNFNLNSGKTKRNWISFGFGFGFMKPPEEK